MNRKRNFFAFCLAVTLLSQTGCCCCVTIPTGPDGGEGFEFGEFDPPEGFDAEGEDSLEAPDREDD